jgi:mannose-1-phosphate guanylyltransferase
VSGQGLVVTGFHEKVENPPGNLANAAVYLLSAEAADFVAVVPGSVIDFSTQIIPQLVGPHLYGGESRLSSRSALSKA